MAVLVVLVWVVPGGLALTEDLFLEVLDTETSSEDSLEHLVNSKVADSLEMDPREAGEVTTNSKDTPHNNLGTLVKVAQTISKPRTMQQHGQHTMPSIMLSMGAMEGSMANSRDNSNPSNLPSSLRLLSSSHQHQARIMLSQLLTLQLVRQITVQLGPSTTDNKECTTRLT